MVRLLEKDNRKNTIVMSVIFLIGAWLVAWIRLRNIDIMMGPYIFPDQLGYFTHAAIFNGLSWYQTTDSWYSYGISIVLAIIMKFTHNMASIYKIAIYVNVALGEVGYILGCIFVKQVSDEIDIKKTFVISAVANCCAAYVFQAQVVWAETYVYTFFMLVLVLAFWYAKKTNFLRLILLTASVCALFVIHNRTIVVIPALMAYVFLLSMPEKKILKGCLHLVIVVVLVLGTYKSNSMVKIWFQDREGTIDQEAGITQEWVEANSSVLFREATTHDVRPDMYGFDLGGEYDNAQIHDITEKNSENNLMGRLFNLTLVFNDPNALIGMIKSFFGSLWYLLSSTAGMAVFGLVFLFNRAIAGLKKSASVSEKSMACFCCFIILCALFSMAETGYNAMWYPQYTYNTEGAVYWEMLFYGRYVELLSVPLTIVGLADILENKNKKQTILECCVVLVLILATSLMVYYESVQLKEPLLNLVCVPGIYGMIERGIGAACVIPIIVGVFVYLLVKISLLFANKKVIGTVLNSGAAIVLLTFFYVNLVSVEVYNNEAQIALNGYNEIAEVLHNNTDIKVIIDSNNVLRDRYFRLRTQAIDNDIVYDAQIYYEEDADIIYLTDELQVENFMSEHAGEDISLLWYGNYPMIIRGAGLIERLALEGYEMR